MYKEPKFEAVRPINSEANERILAGFTPEQQEEIENKRKILTSLAFFIGKDFNIPVELNEPGKGWHWDFKNNVIRIDPKDLLEKSMDYLRFVISHEGGHRRISRTDFIPEDVWSQPGFSFMMNSIEDPRDNNFVAESYPKFREQMGLAYQSGLDNENGSAEKARQKLGYQPRFMLAGFEYIRQWFGEESSLAVKTREDLPEEVRAVVEKTKVFARSSWLAYPTKKMADGQENDEDGLTGEASITNHAKYSYNINLKKIWPEFQRLVEQDQKEQGMQELLGEMLNEKQQRQQRDGGGQELPQELKDGLTEEEREELEAAIEKALDKLQKGNKGDDGDMGEKNGKIEKREKEKEGEGGEEKGGEKGEEGEGAEESVPGGEASESGEGKGEETAEAGGKFGRPIDLDSLSDGLKQKIKEYIDGLPDDKKQALAERAKQALKDFEADLNEELAGKLKDSDVTGQQRKDDGAGQDKEKIIEADKTGKDDRQGRVDFSQKDQAAFRRSLDNIFSEAKNDPYRQALKEIAPMIDGLTGDLRDIFIKRKQQAYEAEYRSGKRWNVKKRIKEVLSGIPLFKSEAREQKNIESEEKDYAITLLIDLSGSMTRGRKIEEAFKSTVLLAETLHDLDINFEVVGFQDILIEFKKFDAPFNDEMRDKLNQLLLEAKGGNPGGRNNPGDNNDGECLLAASDHLARQMAENKFLIVLSDGEPAMDSGRKSSGQLDQELKEAVRQIKENTGQKLIGIGLLSRAVMRYYENNIPNVSAKELSEVLGGIIREIIENY